MFDRQIDVEKTVDDVKNIPYNLPKGFEWSNVDITDKVQADEVYKLLT